MVSFSLFSSDRGDRIGPRRPERRYGGAEKRHEHQQRGRSGEHRRVHRAEAEKRRLEDVAGCKRQQQSRTDAGGEQAAAPATTMPTARAGRAPSAMRTPSSRTRSEISSDSRLYRPTDALDGETMKKVYRFYCRSSAFQLFT